MELPEFKEFNKIARWSRDIVITEKIDGTNGQILVTEDGWVIAGSRSRWLTGLGKDDNYGFNAWCQENKEELLKLGVGSHFGEWWGSGVNRAYGYFKGERFFSLFNVAKWSDDTIRPKCCLVVPTLYTGANTQNAIESAVKDLRDNGSKVANFDRPEGIVIYHSHSNTLFKKTLEKDELPKSFWKDNASPLQSVTSESKTVKEKEDL